jgi:hypothetical protein
MPFRIHATPSHAQTNASGHACTRGHNAATTATAIANAPIRKSSPTDRQFNRASLILFG